jgi:hypothetical protein
MVGEELPVCPAELRPPADVRYQHPRANHVGAIRTQVSQGALDEIEAALGLGVGVAGGEGPSLIVERGRSGDVDVPAGLDGSSVPYFRFPRRSRERPMELHGRRLRGVRRSGQRLTVPALLAASKYSERPFVVKPQPAELDLTAGDGG